MKAKHTQISGLLVGAGAALALTFVAAPAASADESWGAIAISPDSSRWGLTTGQTSAGIARGVAAYKCTGNGPGCNGNITPFSDCAVLVRDGDTLFAVIGATKQDAESAAQGQHPGAIEVSWGCNNPQEYGPTSYRG